MNLRRITASFHPSTLVGKLLCWILPAVLLSLCALAISGYFTARPQIARAIAQQMHGLVEQVAINIDAFLAQGKNDLEALTETPLLIDYYKFKTYPEVTPGEFKQEIQLIREGLDHRFQSLVARNDAYEQIFHVEADGSLVAGVGQDGPLLDASTLELDLEWLGTSTHAPHAPISLVRSLGGHRELLLAKPHLDSDGKLAGATVLVCDLSALQAILDRMGGALGDSYILDRSGQVIVGARPDTEPGLRDEVRLKNLPWSVVVLGSEQEFIGPLIFLRNLTVLVSVLVTVAVTGLLIAVVRRATRPINEMVAGTRRLAAGDLAYRFPLPPLRDLQNLSVAFNDMAGNLKTRSEALENRINQLSALRMMEQTVIQGLDEESILRTTLRAVAKGLGFDRAGLYWVDESRRQVVGRYSHFNYPSPLTEATFRQRTVPLGADDILNRVITTRQAQLVKDPVHHSGVNMRYVKEAGTGEFVMAPLCGQDHVYGVITADNCHTHRPLQESDRDGLMLFASAAGMALENARLMARVAESEARHRMVLENSPVAILGLSRDHRIVTWNRGAEAMFGYATSQIRGQPFHRLLPDSARPELDLLLGELMRAGAVRDYPMKGRKSSGEMLDMTISWGGKNPDFLTNDEWAVVIRDVTEARKLQSQLILSEKLSVVGQLIAGIAHELNNPLQAVIGYAQLLASAPHPSSADRELDSLYRSAQRCRRIIDNLLLFVRQGEVRKQPASLRKAIDAALELLGHKLRRDHVEVSVVTPEPDPYVHGNFQQLEQVFINLVNNACDAMRDQAEPRRIDVRVEQRQGRAFVRVADSGPGIPPEVGERIFEPFFTTKGEGCGTGLGLALCRQIIQEHSGQLRLGPPERPGAGGTILCFDLPACDPPADSEPDHPAAAHGVPPRRVFLVDDEPEVRALLQDVLEAQGHRVTTADSLAAAFDAAGKGTFDLVVSDVYLNDGRGPDLYQQWAEHSSHPRPRFMFLTGDIVNPSLEAACAQMGACVLQKPVDLREFRSAVARVLEHGTARPAASTSHI